MVLFGQKRGVENILNLTVVIVTQHCECTKDYSVVHFEWVNYMVCKLYHANYIHELYVKKNTLGEGKKQHNQSYGR